MVDLDNQQRKTASKIKQGGFLFALFFLISSTISMAVAAENIQPASSSSKKCPHPPKSDSRIVAGLKKVYLIVRFPQKYEEALKCHGHEEECSKNVAANLPNFDHIKYINHLKDVYQQYPQALNPEYLESVLQKQVATLMPYVETDESCNPATPITLKRGGLTNDMYDDGSLTITLKVELFNINTQAMAVLSSSLFRPEKKNFFYSYSIPNTTIIPLNISDESVHKQVEIFLKEQPYSKTHRCLVCNSFKD